MFVLVGCTKEVDYLLQHSEKTTVIQSIMNPDSLISVYVVQSGDILTRKIEYIDDALVLLYCDNVLIDTLHFNSLNKYNSIIYPIAGKTYKIVTIMPDGKSLWGETTIPIKPLECNPLFTPDVLYFDEQNYGLLELDIIDNVIEDNFYELLLFEFDTAYPNQGKFFNSNYYIYEIDDVVTNEGDWEYDPLTIFFSDELFNGKIHSFNCTIAYGSYISTSSGNTISISNAVKKGYTSLRNISYDYYKFRKSYTRHLYNSGIQSDGIINLLYIGDPVDMYSNVNGGLGIIASYNEVTEKIKKKL